MEIVTEIVQSLQGLTYRDRSLFWFRVYFSEYIFTKLTDEAFNAIFDIDNLADYQILAIWVNTNKITETIEDIMADGIFRMEQIREDYDEFDDCYDEDYYYDNLTPNNDILEEFGIEYFDEWAFEMESTFINDRNYNKRAEFVEYLSDYEGKKSIIPDNEYIEYYIELLRQFRQNRYSAENIKYPIEFLYYHKPHPNPKTIAEEEKNDEWEIGLYPYDMRRFLTEHFNHAKSLKSNINAKYKEIKLNKLFIPDLTKLVLRYL